VVEEEKGEVLLQTGTSLISANFIQAQEAVVEDSGQHNRDSISTILKIPMITSIARITVPNMSTTATTTIFSKDLDGRNQWEEVEEGQAQETLVQVPEIKSTAKKADHSTETGAE
jgi:hypothetical protein